MTSREAADRAGLVVLIATVLKMGHHISGQPSGSYPANQAATDALALYTAVSELCGAEPGRAF